MVYSELDKLLQGRCRLSRKLANNTYAVCDGEVLAIRLHQTNILTFYPDGSVRVSSGGWRTVTTKQRLNRFLPGEIYVFSRDRQWWIKRPWQNRADEEFRDGWLISPEEVALGMLQAQA